MNMDGLWTTGPFIIGVYEPALAIVHHNETMLAFSDYQINGDG